MGGGSHGGANAVPRGNGPWVTPMDPSEDEAPASAEGAGTVSCSRCGHESPGTAQYCTNCGAPLFREARPAPPASDTPRRRTRTGFLLLFVAFVLLVLPLISVVGLILAIVAVILVYMGAEAYGDRHRRYVLGAILLWIGIFVALIVVLAVLLTPVILAVLEGGSLEPFRDAFLTFVVVAAAGNAVLGVPYLLIAYRLLGPDRTLGWGILGVHVAAAAGLGVYQTLNLNAAMEALSGGTVPLLGPGLDLASFGFSLVNLLWALLYYRIYRRVDVS